MKTYFFNSDFEKQLFSNTPKKIELNKVNQEFEYFIHFLDPDSLILSTRKYSKAYQDFIYDFTGKTLQTTLNRTSVIHWCNPMENLEECRFLQNKINVLKLMLENNYISEEIQFINDKDQLKENKLYIYPKSLSGGGHLKYPRDINRMNVLLAKKEMIIEENLLSRSFDFSTLIMNQRVICEYENEIDEYFQYKGTLIGEKLKELISYQEVLMKTRELIFSHLGSYKGALSIDSFLYFKNDQTLLYPACEVNMRKTMGYTTFFLKEKYFKKIPFLKLKLIKNKNFKSNYLDIKRNYGDQIYLISPLDNLFLVFLILGQDKLEIMHLENDLFTRLF